MDPDLLRGLVLIGLAFGAGWTLRHYWPWLQREFGNQEPIRWGQDQSDRLRRLHERAVREREGFEQARHNLVFQGTDRWRKQ